MKYRTTQKAVKDGYTNVLEIGYCNAQSLLRFHNPVAYTCETYGWNSDIYAFGNVAISTGYRAFGNVKPDYEIVRKYDERAEKIFHNQTWHYETKIRKIDKLIDEFIAEVLNK